MLPFDRKPTGLDRRRAVGAPLLRKPARPPALQGFGTRPGSRVLSSCLGLLSGLSFFVTATGVGQTFGATGIKGFKIAEPYGPPHETQIKSVLEGGRALPLGGGMILFSNGVILRNFSET